MKNEPFKSWNSGETAAKHTPACFWELGVPCLCCAFPVALLPVWTGLMGIVLESLCQPTLRTNISLIIDRPFCLKPHNWLSTEHLSFCKLIITAGLFLWSTGAVGLSSWWHPLGLVGVRHQNAAKLRVSFLKQWLNALLSNITQ